jgi:farnesyl-diphosphate farnesyltransferase
MAVLTLNKINNHRDFKESAQVKISRRAVKATVFTTSLFAGNNNVLKQLFNMASRKLPETTAPDEWLLNR